MKRGRSPFHKIKRTSSKQSSAGSITTGAGLNFALASDLLRNPRDVSRVVAITAFGGNLFGLVAPIITGYVVSGTGGYTWAFRIAAALLFCGCLATLGMTRRPIKPQYA